MAAFTLHTELTGTSQQHLDFKLFGVATVFFSVFVQCTAHWSSGPWLRLLGAATIHVNNLRQNQNSPSRKSTGLKLQENPHQQYGAYDTQLSSSDCHQCHARAHYPVCCEAVVKLCNCKHGRRVSHSFMYDSDTLSMLTFVAGKTNKFGSE